MKYALRKIRKLPLRKYKKAKHNINKEKETVDTTSDDNSESTEECKEHLNKEIQVAAFNYLLQLRSLNGGSKRGDIKRVVKRYHKLGHYHVTRGTLNYAVTCHKKKPENIITDAELFAVDPLLETSISKDDALKKNCLLQLLLNSKIVKKRVYLL